MSVEKGLLRETETVQVQISALLKCDVSWPLKIPGVCGLMSIGPRQRAGERDHNHGIPDVSIGSSSHVPCYEPSYD